VLVNDGSTAPVNAGAIGTIDDGCQPFTAPAGSIALVVRGGCNFTLKIINGQNTGAIAVIVGNNIPGPPTGMSATGNEFRAAQIPSVMISQSDYAIFKPAAPFNATITDGTNNAIQRDSDVDSGVIAHEYGHGISNRLTGGPSRVNCLNNVEQMGEGWSDFVALTLTTTPADTPLLARGIGTYVSFLPNDGNGI
jgi:extracellular elastinolytic metalloproteinase